MKKKRLSPFSIDFWVKKGYSIEEADYKRNSIRPIKKEYWIEKGYSEEEAIKMAIQKKEENNKKGSKVRSSFSEEKQKESSPRCIEYWVKRGYSKDNAKQEVSKVQSTFSLEKCIENYGETEGRIVWENRQKKWQNTLNSKTEDEIKRINSLKNAISIHHYDSIDNAISHLNETRNMSLVGSIEDFISFVEKDLEKHVHKRYIPAEVYLEQCVNACQKQILEYNGNSPEYMLSSIQHLFSFSKYLVKKGKYQQYRLWTKEGLLRSSYEIYFYEKIKEKCPDVEIQIDNKYPNSSFRYDFFVNGDYIEICPLLNINESYTKKMEKKKRLFGCVLLSSVQEIDAYILEI